MTAQPILQECRTTPEADVLSKCIDLLAWTQISNQIVSLAVIYLLRALLHISGKYCSIWAIWIACVRIAQILLEDESFGIHVWKQALPAVGEPTRELAQAEILLLTCSDLSFVVEPREWEVLTQRLEHVSGSCVQRLETLLSNAVPSSETMSRWEQHRAEIGRLYQNHSLEEVVRLMKERHNFAPRYVRLDGLDEYTLADQETAFVATDRESRSGGSRSDKPRRSPEGPGSECLHPAAIELSWVACIEQNCLLGATALSHSMEAKRS
jgi:hypothetical protein